MPLDTAFDGVSEFLTEFADKIVFWENWNMFGKIILLIVVSAVFIIGYVLKEYFKNNTSKYSLSIKNKIREV